MARRISEDKGLMVLSPAQCRAGRAMLLWSQERLAREAGVAKGTVLDFERGIRRPISHNRQALRRALEEAGLSIIPEDDGGRGVRFREPTEEKPVGFETDEGDDG